MGVLLVPSGSAAGRRPAGSTSLALRHALGWRARLRQAALVGEDHRLDPVACTDLHEDALDVGLDRRFLDDESGCDLAVRESASDELEDFALARSELMETLAGRGIGDGLAGHAL